MLFSTAHFISVMTKYLTLYPGDVIWLPEKTPITYEGEKAIVCYALYPVDWRKRHSL